MASELTSDLNVIDSDNSGKLFSAKELNTFPENPNIRKVWIKSTGRPHLEPTANSRICSKHFNENLFRRTIYDITLHPKAIPTLLIHNDETNSTLKVCETSYVQDQMKSKIMSFMEAEEWPVNRLEQFAAAYIKYEVFYKKPASHHMLDMEFALGSLAGMLGLPNDHSMEDRCRQFRYQLLCYVRCRVCACAERDEHWARALQNAPLHVAAVANKLAVSRIAVQAELMRLRGEVRRWAVRAVTRELAKVCAAGAEGAVAEQRALLAASAAVFDGAAPVPEDLWRRLCEVKKLQLLKLERAGDRAPQLCLGERLAQADWALLDQLLLHGAEEDVPLVTEVSLHWRESLRALVLLVELVAAIPARARGTHSHAVLWRALHSLYTGTGRSASVVLLQRRWHQLLQLARVAVPHFRADRAPPPPLPRAPSAPPAAPHPLLALVAARFLHVVQRKNTPWARLVRTGQVAIGNSYSTPVPEPNVVAIQMVDVTELENYKTTRDIEQYIERKLQYTYGIYFNGICWKKYGAETVTSDCGNAGPNGTDRSSSLNDFNNKAELEIQHVITSDSDSEVDEEIIDGDEHGAGASNKAENSSNYVEFDYISDVLQEVEGLKQLDDTENVLDEIDKLKSFKVFKIDKECNAESVKYVDNSKISHDIKYCYSNTGKLVYINASTTSDPKLAKEPRVKLSRIDETYSWRKYAINNRINTTRSGLLRYNPKNEISYVSDASAESEGEINFMDKFTYDNTSRNPDLNPRLKRLPKRFRNLLRNRELMKLCKPVMVKLTKLVDTEISPRGRVVKRVKLADIEEVRRINKNILTAQVEPMAVHSLNDMSLHQRRLELVRVAQEQANRPLVVDIKQVNRELKMLFTTPAETVEAMIFSFVYNLDEEGMEKINAVAVEAAECHEECQPRQTDASSSCSEMGKALGQQKIIANKYFEIGTKKIESKDGDDLDDVLSCTIIKKPTAEENELETDEGTRAFFVSSTEELVASTAEATPVITDVCSLAAVDTAINKQISNPTNTLTILSSVTKPSNERRMSVLEQAIQRLKLGTAVGAPQLVAPMVTAVVTPVVDSVGVPQLVTGDGSTTPRLIVMPNSFTFRLDPIGDKKANDTTQSCPAGVTQLASLTPVLVKNAHTSTITLAPVTYAPPAPPTLRPLAAVTSPLAPAPAPVYMHQLLPISANINVVGFCNSTDESSLSAMDTPKWVEPGRIAPPSALSLVNCTTPNDYLAQYRPGLAIAKLDSSKPLWTVAEEYLILAEKILPCKEPTYWTIGSVENCKKLVWPMNETGESNEKPSEYKASDIVIQNVIGNYDLEGIEVKSHNDDVTVINVSDSDSDVDMVSPEGRGRACTLKVRSFAKCGRSETNVLGTQNAGTPDVLPRGKLFYKKMTDNPPLYSQMLTVVSSTEECDALLRERAPLHVWSRRGGGLSALQVAAPPHAHLPACMASALLVRHADCRLLTDMAHKFVQLNSANALVRKNQLYVFAPTSGTLLVAPPGVAGVVNVPDTL